MRLYNKALNQHSWSWRKFPLWFFMSPSLENVIEPDSSKWGLLPLELHCGKSGDKSWYCQLLNVSSGHCHSAAVIFCSKRGVTSVQFTINVNSSSAGSSPAFLVRLSAISYLFFSEAECCIRMLKVSSDSCNLISSCASSLCIWSVVNKTACSHTSVWPSLSRWSLLQQLLYVHLVRMSHRWK